MAHPAANLGFGDNGVGAKARGFDPPLPGKTHQALADTKLKNKMRAGIGHEDPGDPALETEARRPRLLVLARVNQAALLDMAAAMKVGVVVRAFRSSRGTHGVEGMVTA